MSGIVFFSTTSLQRVVDFYVGSLGCSVWLDQGGCVILKHGNMLVGFYEGSEADVGGVVTFFYSTRGEVDAVYGRLAGLAECAPLENPRYKIYHFYARDPDGRRLEAQCFLHGVSCFVDGGGLLEGRRSVRHFADDDVGADVLSRVFGMCSFAPSSRNQQPCTLVVVRSKEVLCFLAGLRGESSAPIARAPMAVAVVSDPGLSKRHIQDGCIMAYHLLLAASYHGLGTCWIAAMDRDDAKQALGVPLDHYVATITPLGYALENPAVPERMEARVKHV